MTISLTKGQVINLSKGSNGLRRIRIGLGWDAAEQKKGLFGFSRTSNIDCDASAVLLEDGELLSKTNLIYYGNETRPGIHHTGDNLTGEGEGDDETIIVTLPELRSTITSIDFFVNIYQADSRDQDFGMIKNAYIHVVNDETGEELARYNLSDNYSGFTTLSAGILQKNGSDWEFKASGEGTKDTSISQYIAKYM